MASRLVMIDKKVAEQLATLAMPEGIYKATDVLALAGLSTHPHAIARRAAMYPAQFIWADDGLYMTRILAQFTLWHFYMMQFRDDLKTNTIQ